MGNNSNSLDQELTGSSQASGKGSAERELLKAIEGQSDSAQFTMKKLGDGQSGIFSIISRLRESAGAGAYSLNLGDVKKILIGLVVFLSIWLFLSMIKGVFNFAFIPNYKTKAVQTAKGDGKDGKVIPVEGYNYYSDVLLGRNIFKPEEKKEAEVKQDGGARDLAKNLKISGLAWVPGTRDRFALIEDTKTGITYFLQKGDTISSLVVDDILDDKVILKHMSEEIILR
ncbi:MAG: hypothetical protein HQL30_04200 [Candidatus Omnitrophica bacterium]|nr:hypothetical protein [Candidatus Omnitrophota bacterium]